MKKHWTTTAVTLAVIGAITATYFVSRPGPSADKATSGTNRPPVALRAIVINEALRTILYLPTYHAIERGYFKDAGLDVKVVTGGTATAAFASMLSGESDFAQADPMFVPISREKGGETKVVAQVVARIAVWGVTMDPNLKDMSADSLRGKKIATHPRPMTAWTYTMKTIHDAGLDPDKDVEIVQGTPGTEIAPLLSKQVQYAMTLEPNVSRAISQGAHVVLSYPQLLGDQIFTGLMTRERFLKENRAAVVAIVRGYQTAMDDIRKNPDSAAASAKKYFPQLDDAVIKASIKRMIDEDVLPKSVIVPEESWRKAIGVRVAAGDLKSATPWEDSCALDIMQEAAAGR